MTVAITMGYLVIENSDEDGSPRIYAVDRFGDTICGVHQRHGIWHLYLTARIAVQTGVHLMPHAELVDRTAARAMVQMIAALYVQAAT